eukprot:11210819-Lingulodinium_polyedra.AAC.1
MPTLWFCAHRHCQIQYFAQGLLAALRHAAHARRPGVPRRGRLRPALGQWPGAAPAGQSARAAGRRASWASSAARPSAGGPAAQH